MASEQDGRDIVVSILEKAKIATVTTVDLQGNLVSRPLQLQEADKDGNLWFFTPDPSPKADEVRANPHVNVAINDSKGFLSISGTATVTKDQEKIEELWKSSVEAWFEHGREDPAVALLKVDSHTAEYWASDEPKIASVFKIGKAAVTGGTPDVGKNDVVDL
ncbi:pyridoxamine 5'-phosphate oxidase family protein [Arthrobacter zhangbolii]|uniref:Pyridoxamine 5'-phosphate oxidase family protein n=1 Tax=Arthrobacter zhangbolii TaxID=2886936 RepID=A0A9X1MB87_9MICC|nr:pyridoxamine 5'-phosphate oxidase family protein [Arthrobacter zhangbolii]MCC3273649.1 pyridoxamine 5'-phosphate oxidase family protein [Arthrobacter zhangbolii]MCC3295714.1 pyridoxamine 5'-phosphate oxidase family protein [Arthrobacter zhangbolii]UON92454.1 pyridoxamine 5'-phosphate oxidase family protein [Arthrobacter zhangbolii]